MNYFDFQKEYQCIFMDKQQKIEYKTNNDKFIVFEEIYRHGKIMIKLSVVNKNKFTVISHELYPLDCIRILDKLKVDYNTIIIRGKREYNILIYNLGITRYYISKIDESTIKYLKDNRYLDVLGVFIELHRLEYDKHLLKDIL